MARLKQVAAARDKVLQDAEAAAKPAITDQSASAEVA